MEGEQQLIAGPGGGHGLRPADMEWNVRLQRWQEVQHPPVQGVAIAGVAADVVRAARRYESALEQENPKTRPVMELHGIQQLNEHDARFIMNVLLPRLRAEEAINISHLCRTQLTFDRVPFTPEGLQVFTDAFQNSSIPLTSLELVSSLLDDESCRLLLESLHTNTTVKELDVSHSSEDQDDTIGGWIAQMLQHKKDFSALRFSIVWRSGFNGICASLGHGGYPHLRKLSFNVTLRDEDVQRLVRALVDGNHSSQLEVLGLACNSITSEGLGFLCTLAPSAFPLLKVLILAHSLAHNGSLLINTANVQRFANIMLMAADAVLEELDIQFCASRPEGYIIIVKSLETNRTVRWLNICGNIIGRNLLRDQLIVSLPLMKGLQYLTCHPDLCNENDQELISAYRKNTSLYKVSRSIRTGREVVVTTPLFLAIFRRNKFLFHIENLMEGRTVATTTTTTTATRPRRRRRLLPPPAISEPSGQWMYLLAQVGQGPEGASPVFQVLRGALGNWWEQSNSNTSNNTTAGAAPVVD